MIMNGKNLKITFLGLFISSITIVSCSDNKNGKLNGLQNGSIVSDKGYELNAPNSGVIRVDMGVEIPTLDPQLIEDKNSQRVATDLFMGVVTLDQNNIPIPGLAESWSVSPDGKTYRFYLRDGIKFSDGTPITASDIMFSWRRLVDPKTGSPYTYIASSIINANQITNKSLPVDSLGVKVVDNRTVELSLLYPDDDILAKLALPSFFIVSKNEVEQFNREWTDSKHMVTSGAYMLKEHIINGYLSIKKNPYFYNANKISINEVKFFPLVDANIALAKYKAGELEVTWSVQVDQFKEVANDYKDQLHITPLEGFAYYDINMLRPEFKDIRIRKALNLAVDRVVIAKEVLGTGVTPNYSVVTSSIAGGKYASVVPSWIHDSRSKQIAEARRLYKEAGYSINKPLKLVISYSTDDERKKVALAITSMWKEVLGVDATIQNLDWKTYLQSLQKGDYQIASDRWFADYNGISTYTHLYLCNASENSEKYCNHEYDKYINQATNINNSTLKREAYIKALNIAQNDYATIPLYQVSSKHLVKPYVKGYIPENNHLDIVTSGWFYY